MDETLLLSLCIAGAVTMVVLAITKMVFGKTDERLRDRLTVDNPAATRPAAPLSSLRSEQPGGAGASLPASASAAAARHKRGGAVPLMHRIGQAAARPFMPSKRDNQSALRRKLGYAGIYSSAGMRMMIGCRVILLIAGVTF